MKMVQAHVLYSGTVQGVGFRYTVQRYALQLGITGWVKNLADGNVEVVAQGSKTDLEKLCEDIEGRFKGYIMDKQISFSETDQEYPDFKIVF